MAVHSCGGNGRAYSNSGGGGCGGDYRKEWAGSEQNSRVMVLMVAAGYGSGDGVVMAAGRGGGGQVRVVLGAEGGGSGGKAWWWQWVVGRGGERQGVVVAVGGRARQSWHKRYGEEEACGTRTEIHLIEFSLTKSP